jgi:hypothetical protein
VSLIEFLQLFRDTLLEDTARPNFHTMVGKLRTLFEEIDINGDADMTWEEFTSYIVLNGGSRSKSEHTVQHVRNALAANKPKSALILTSPQKNLSHSTKKRRCTTTSC